MNFFVPKNIDYLPMDASIQINRFTSYLSNQWFSSLISWHKLEQTAVDKIETSNLQPVTSNDISANPSSNKNLINLNVIVEGSDLIFDPSLHLCRIILRFNSIHFSNRQGLCM